PFWHPEFRAWLRSPFVGYDQSTPWRLMERALRLRDTAHMPELLARRRALANCNCHKKLSAEQHRCRVCRHLHAVANLLVRALYVWRKMIDGIPVRNSWHLNISR